MGRTAACAAGGATAIATSHDMLKGKAMMTTTIEIPEKLRTWSMFQDAYAELTARVLRHPFIVRCGEGKASFGELRNFLVQHGRYAGHFTRYLCALISQLEHSEDVLHLAENLVEELGYGSDNRVPHSKIYNDMLDGLGISLSTQAVFPETRNLIDTMFMLCRQPGGLAGFGALYLGAEAIVPVTYAAIMEGLRSHHIPEPKLEFFAMHIACDDEHAMTMYAIIERVIDGSPENVMRIVSAGETAVNARLRFFDGLSRWLP